MKDESESDAKLRKALGTWKVTSALPPRFEEGVWKRIESERTHGSPSVWRFAAEWLTVMLSRPRMAAAYVAVLLAVGAAVGWAQGQKDSARVHAELGDRYVRVLDPYLSPRE